MKNLLQFLLIFFLLMSVVVVKYYFFKNPSSNFFLLSNSDIMLKAPEFLKIPTPVPYVENYVEYPVLVGIWATALAYLSKNATDFFFWNGFLLSFFSAINVLLCQKLSQLVFGRSTAFYNFLLPSTIFFTFYNWESLALFFLLISLVFFYQRRYFWGWLASILGFWTKIFPLISLGLVSLEDLIARRYRQLLFILGTVLVVTVSLNLKFYLLNARGLIYFFEFSRNRPPNIDSIWSGVYVLSDKIFGSGFFLKGYYNDGIGFASFILFGLGAFLYFFFKLRKGSFHYLWDTTFLIGLGLLTSKVYSPQFNLWLVPLLVVCGLNFRKIVAFDLLNLLVAWAVFQYFREVFIVGRTVLSFPYFKLFYFFVVARHLVLLWLVLDLWRQRKSYETQTA